MCKGLETILKSKEWLGKLIEQNHFLSLYLFENLLCHRNKKWHQSNFIHISLFSLRQNLLLSWRVTNSLIIFFHTKFLTPLSQTKLNRHWKNLSNNHFNQLYSLIFFKFKLSCYLNWWIIFAVVSGGGELAYILMCCSELCQGLHYFSQYSLLVHTSSLEFSNHFIKAWLAFHNLLFSLSSS